MEMDWIRWNGNENGLDKNGMEMEMVLIRWNKKGYIAQAPGRAPARAHNE